MKQLTALLQVFVCLYVLDVGASDLYKWKDKSGNIQYSQNPPDSQTTNNYKRAKTGATFHDDPYVVRGNHEYCGKYLLPGKPGDPIDTLNKIDSNYNKWESLFYISLGKYNKLLKLKKKYKKDDSKLYIDTENKLNVTKSAVKKYDCFLQWARDKRKSPYYMRVKTQYKKTQAETRYNNLLNERFLECGDTPSDSSYAGDGWYIGADVERWLKCRKKYEAILEHARMPAK